MTPTRRIWQARRQLRPLLQLPRGRVRVRGRDLVDVIHDTLKILEPPDEHRHEADQP